MLNSALSKMINGLLFRLQVFVDNLPLSIVMIESSLLLRKVFMIRRRLGKQTILVYEALAKGKKEWYYGLELATNLNLSPNTVYSIIDKLQDDGLIEGQWDNEHSLTTASAGSRGKKARYAIRLNKQGKKYVDECLMLYHQKKVEIYSKKSRQGRVAF